MTALRTSLDAPSTALRLAGSTSGGDAHHGWVPIARAAEIIGRSVGHLKRECPRWEKQGLAAMLRPQGSRNASWHLHPRCHPRLSHAHVLPDAPGAMFDAAGEARTPERRLLEASEARRDEARRKAHIVIAFREWRRQPGVRVRAPGGFDSFAASIAKRLGCEAPSRTRVYSWCEACGSSEDFAACAAALLDTRGGARVGSSDGGDESGGDASDGPGGGGGGGSSPGAAPGVSPEAWSMFEALYLSSKAPIAKCWRAVKAHAEERGWSWPSKRHAARLVRERIEPGRLCMAREGAQAWREKHQVPAQQEPDKFAPGERWDADHCVHDCFVRVRDHSGAWVAVRPWLTAWLDWRSRTLVGWRISTQPNAETVQLALLHALRHGPAQEFGPPVYAWMDNGKDFDSRAITGLTKSERRLTAANRRRLVEALPGRVGGGALMRHDQAVGLLDMLGVTPRFGTPYNPNSKSRVERWFGWMHSDFDTEWASYCGSERSPVDPAALKAALADVMALPTLAAFAARFNQWAMASNLRTDHEIDDLDERDEHGEPLDRLSPLAFYAARCVARRRPEDGALALLEQKWERPLKVGKQGVGVTIKGRVVHYGATAPELEALKGADRVVRVTIDPSDLRTIRVYDDSFAFLCLAHHNEAIGSDGPLTREALGRVIKAQNDQRRAARRRVDPLLALGTTIDAAYAEQRRIDTMEGRRLLADSREGEAPAPLHLVRTPIDGQARLVEAAEARLALAPPPEPFDDDVDLADVAHDARAIDDESGGDDADLGDVDAAPRTEEDEDFADEAIGAAFAADDPDDFDVLGALE